MIRMRRRNLFPRQISDIGAFLFVVIMIPATFIYEVSVVLNELYESYEIMRFVHLTVGIFLLVNVIGNFIGLWLTDTSTRNVILPTVIKQRWEFCASCEAVQPPRAWHCSACGVCILKREHHCMFAGYCVGHRNHRFFILFLTYIWISVTYCTYFNTRFLALHISELTWPVLLKFIFPLLSLITFDVSLLQLYIFFWSAHFAAFLLTTVLLIYHANLILKGATTYENNASKYSYNLGRKQNVIEVLGDNWRRVIWWPFAKSKLPHDGINWDTSDSWRLEGPKNR